jgi:polyphosphate kinase
MDTQTQSRAVTLKIRGKERIFDIDLPDLPDWIEDAALKSGGFPYDKKLSDKDYVAELTQLQIELVKVQFWMQKTGQRVMALFEGRDAAGKGGAISATLSYMNPRSARVVALTKPTETETGQWYFQRYVSHFPSAGEFVLFDRSWYNRAGVEPVMNFCKPEQYEAFLKQAPRFEKLIEQEGIHFFKF